MLAAVLNGWAEPSMLDAYQAERQPITDQVSQFAFKIAKEVSQQRREISASELCCAYCTSDGRAFEYVCYPATAKRAGPRPSQGHRIGRAVLLTPRSNVIGCAPHTIIVRQPQRIAEPLL